jgi:hypothetical protein
MNKLFLLFLSVFTLALQAQNTSLVALHNTEHSSVIEFSTSEVEFETIENRGELYTRIIAQGMTESYDLGMPNLPVFTKLIEVPVDGAVSVEILNEFDRTISLADIGFVYELEPAQRSIFKSEDPLKVEFLKNESTYQKDAFYRQDLIKVERLGTMRGKSIAKIQIAPFAYHPLTNELQVVENIKFKVNFESAIEPVSPAYNSRDYQSLFSNLLNSDLSFKSNFSSEPMKMVVVADPMFEEGLQEFINWKRRKGFEIIELYKGADGVGETFESIKASIQELYDSATELSPAPTYLLIVGDIDQIPSYETGSHVSDMYYCEFDGGGDYFPEMFFGRFSANSVDELMPQIDKTMQYEMYSMPDPSYLGEVLLVSGVDSYYAQTHGNGQINYGTEYYFNEDHNLETYTYLYPESDTWQAEEAIIDHVSQGVGFANYTAHCSLQGWADPSFVVSDVSGLQNEDEYGLMIGNCCQSNTFNGVTCFGEALLRESKAGAVGYIGGSNNTLWDEDFYWGVGNGPVSANPTYEETSEGVYDCSFHENEEAEEDWTISQGQIMHAGNWAVTESSSSNIQYYWEIYHLMGDPSVLTYYGVPSELSISHPAAIPVGMSSISVVSEQYTYVAASQGGVLLDASHTDAAGNVVLSFDPINSVEAIEIVASKQNKQVYIGEVNVMSTNAPFVTFSELLINDGAEGNSMAEYNESFSLDVTLQNFGLVDAQSMDLTVLSSNPLVVVSSANETISSIAAESSITIADAVSVQLNSGLQDQEVVTLTFVVVDEEGNEWTTYGSFIVNAPNLEFSSHTVNDDDGNAFIDFGESAELLINLGNIGNASSLVGEITVSTDFGSLQIIENNIEFDALESGESTTVSVLVQLDEDAPAAQEYSVSVLALTEDGYQAEYVIPFETSSCLTGAMEVQFSLATDYYGHEIAWNLSSADGVVLSSAELGTVDSDTNYEEVFCLENNSYLTFEIIDDYGDGLNSEGYSFVVCGEAVASGADYGYGEVVSFIAGCDQTLEVGCTNEESSNYNPEAVVDDGSCLEVSLEDLVNSVHIYPNPAQSRIHFQLGDLQVESILLLQADGKEVLKTSVNDSDTELNVESLDSGYYLVKIKLEDGTILSKSIIVM